MAESHFTHHDSCPACKSSDALARYSDGHGYCWSCSHYEHGDKSTTRTEKRRLPSALIPLEQIEHTDLPKRKLTRATCEKWGYGTAKHGGQAVQVATYRDSTGTPVSQKLRGKDKAFSVLGGGNMPLYGMHLWRGTGRQVIVTEGEIDAMSVSQLQDHKWPVVSVPSGAKGAAKAFRENITFLEQFDQVKIAFDMDEPGREAALECAEILTPGKAFLVEWPMKDANELLVAGRNEELIAATWNARPYRPDGIVDANSLLAAVLEDNTKGGIQFPWAGINEKTMGLREGEIFTLGAGTGMGKSTVCGEIGYHFLKAGLTVGHLALEEPVHRTAQRYLGIALNKPIHISRKGVKPAEIEEAHHKLFGTSKLHLYDHFGSTAADNLLNRMRFMVKGLGCQLVILDHLSIVVSGMTDADGDERRLIDNLMTRLREFTEETRCRLILVSHLTRPEGKGHEDGGKVSLRNFRGSAAIVQLSDFALGLERDQQNEATKNVTTLRMLKNRWTGDTGEAGCVQYDASTGRLTECDPAFANSPDNYEDA